jgi:glucose-6-phosphate-specific signal transduction histidine kinase
VIAGRPEQVVFFVPIILVTFMLALKMKSGMVTVSWGVEGVLIFLLALAVKERSFRLTGLGVLLLCVGKVLALDFWGLQTRDRWITLISLGAALMFVSFLYTRYRETIRQYL